MDVRKPLKRNKSKQSCCVPDCNTPGYGKTVTFHVLPKDAKLLKNMDCKNWQRCWTIIPNHISHKDMFSSFY